MRLVSIQLWEVEDAASLNPPQLDGWTTTSLGYNDEQTAIPTQSWFLLAATEMPSFNRSLPAATGNQTQADACR